MTMKTMFADFNAMTEAGHVSLSTCGSRADIERTGARSGDWAWLSDGEVIVGAQLALDDHYGLVGVPDWDTLVHLDEEGADDFDRVRDELKHLVTKDPPSMADEPRILELLTQLEHFTPPHLRDTVPGMLVFRRALALRNMGKLGLALLEMREARRVHPDDQEVAFVYLDLLRLEDLPSAFMEAEKHHRIAAGACPGLVGVHQHTRDPGRTGARRPVRVDRGARARAVSSFRSGSGSRPRGRIARSLVLLQPRNRTSSSGPNFASSTGVRTGQ